MCGIVGMASSNSTGFFSQHQDIFKDLLWADTLRGDDSTGIFGVNKYGNVDFLKTLGNAGALLYAKEYEEFEKNIYTDYRFIVGHNRKATKGALKEENAHPFVEESTILVHNGTIYNHSDLTKKEFEVDSHAILHSIVERGYEKTIEEIHGAFTLVWYDAQDKHLRLIRNEERPMYIANTYGAWIFASEAGMLEWICERRNLKIQDMTVCVPGTMYFFDLEDNKHQLWNKKLQLRKPFQTVYPAVVHKKETEEKKDLPPFNYTNTDFKLNTKITFTIDNLVQKKKENDYILYGSWFLDPTVHIRANLTDEELTKLENKLNRDVEGKKDLLLSGSLKTVITNISKRKVTLVLENLVPFNAVSDSTGKEILPDEFMFTDQNCSHCCKQVTIEQLQKGVFKYATEEDFEIICPDCMPKVAA